jgi:hypothetical protein
MSLSKTLFIIVLAMVLVAGAALFFIWRWQPEILLDIGWQKPRTIFADDFISGDTKGWILKPESGYWFVENGELKAGGKTIWPWDQDSHEASRSLRKGANYWEARIAAPTTAKSNSGISVVSRDGLYAVFFVVDHDNALKWSVRTEGVWQEWKNVGTVDRTTMHSYAIELGSDGTFSVLLDGVVKASGITAGPVAAWVTGFGTGVLYTQSESSGQILNTRFDDVVARRTVAALKPQ